MFIAKSSHRIKEQPFIRAGFAIPEGALSTLESWSMNVLYQDFGLKPAVFGYLSNVIAPPPIALESCSRA